jgi:hypothetical protein
MTSESHVEPERGSVPASGIARVPHSSVPFTNLREALRASIERFGVIYPVVVNVDGFVLDGWRRIEVCGHIGMKYPVVVLIAEGAEVPTDLDSRVRAVHPLLLQWDVRRVPSLDPDDLVQSLNMDRVHFSGHEQAMSQLLWNLSRTAGRFMWLADKLPESIEEADQERIVGMTEMLRDTLDGIEENLPLVVVPYEVPNDAPPES